YTLSLDLPSSVDRPWCAPLPRLRAAGQRRGRGGRSPRALLAAVLGFDVTSGAVRSPACTGRCGAAASRAVAGVRATIDERRTARRAPRRTKPHAAGGGGLGLSPKLCARGARSWRA